MFHVEHQVDLVPELLLLAKPLLRDQGTGPHSNGPQPRLLVELASQGLGRCLTGLDVPARQIQVVTLPIPAQEHVAGIMDHTAGDGLDALGPLLFTGVRGRHAGMLQKPRIPDQILTQSLRQPGHRVARA